jgi:hypothetical protein
MVCTFGALLVVWSVRGGLNLFFFFFTCCLLTTIKAQLQWDLLILVLNMSCYENLIPKLSFFFFFLFFSFFFSLLACQPVHLIWLTCEFTPQSGSYITRIILF